MRRGRTVPRWIGALGLLLCSGVIQAQSSANHVLQEYVFNSGGNPADGAAPASASFRLSLDSIGGGVSGAGMTSASNSLDACFTTTYAPPGEVQNLLLDETKAQLIWDAEPSVGAYNLYRGALSALTDLTYGACGQTGLTEAAANDGDPVPVGDGFFYLVTAQNRLGEEGTKGNQSNGTDRANAAACP